MKLGDLFEWVAAAAFVAAAYLWLGLPLALLAAGLCLAYLAQVYADLELPSARLPRLRHRLRRLGRPVPKMKAGEPVFHCTTCDYEGPASVPHVCPAT